MEGRKGMSSAGCQEAANEGAQAGLGVYLGGLVESRVRLLAGLVDGS